MQVQRPGAESWQRHCTWACNTIGAAKIQRHQTDRVEQRGANQGSGSPSSGSSYSYSLDQEPSARTTHVLWLAGVRVSSHHLDGTAPAEAMFVALEKL